MKLVGIIGPARVGKSTLADFMIDRGGHLSVRTYELASILKKLRPQREGEAKEIWRKDLQEIGAARRATLGPHHLVHGLEAMLPVFKERKTSVLVIPDVRLHAEADRLKEMGAMIIQMTATMEARRSRFDDPEAYEKTRMDLTEQEAARMFRGADICVDNSLDLLTLKSLAWFLLEKVFNHGR